MKSINVSKSFSACFLIILIACFSCSDQNSKVKVQFNSKYSKEHKVTIDDTIVLASNTNQSFGEIQLHTGKHKLRIDDTEQKEFSVPDAGGILNIANDEFVIFPVKFSLGKETIGQTASGMPNALLIDSFVVASETYFKIFGKQITKKDVDSLDNGTERTELLMTPKTTLFVAKTWDLDLDEEIPNSIEDEVSKNTKEATRFKKKIMRSEDFLKSALDLSGQFFALPKSTFKD